MEKQSIDKRGRETPRPRLSVPLFPGPVPGEFIKMSSHSKRANIFNAALYMAEIMEQTLIEESPVFTGKINFTVNCNSGGIGSISAYSQLEILKKEKINVDKKQE